MAYRFRTVLHTETISSLWCTDSALCFIQKPFSVYGVQIPHYASYRNHFQLMVYRFRTVLHTETISSWRNMNSKTSCSHPSAITGTPPPSVPRYSFLLMSLCSLVVPMNSDLITSSCSLFLLYQLDLSQNEH